MLKIVLTASMLPLLLLFGSRDDGSSTAPDAAKTSLAEQGESGTLQKMIVASGSVSMDIDLNRINGVTSTTENWRHYILASHRLLSSRSLSLTMCCAEQSQDR